MTVIIPKHELGQHWLINPAALISIANLTTNKDKPLDLVDVVEIGPGQGNLTDQLLLNSAISSIVAIEIDNQLVSFLRDKYNGEPKLKIILGDIRKYNFNLFPANYVITANIPYYLTNYLLRLLAETNNKPLQAVLLIQKEVATRLIQQAGNLSTLAIFIQNYYQISYELDVNRLEFDPVPKVDSAVVKLIKRPLPLVDCSIEPKFNRLVRIAFAQKRKTITNNLSSGLKITKKEIEEILNLLKFNLLLRPQQLSIDDWQKLTIMLINKNML